MKKIAIVVHGGAGADSEFIRGHEKEYKEALAEAVNLGYTLLEKGQKSLDVVEKVVNYFEDNYLFNAGKGSAITNLGKVEMCASVMDGSDLNSGAVATVYNIKHPVSLARKVLEHTEHIYLSHDGASNFAKESGMQLEPDLYFHTLHQVDAWLKKREEEMQKGKSKIKQGSGNKKKNSHSGTVGCVALDIDGNIAAATSTGGTENSKEGRIGDSSMIGVGTYANNKTCAVSTTGDGEYAIRGVLAHDVSAVVEYKKLPLQEALRFVLFEKNKDTDGDLGIIALDCEGNMALEFNCDRMHRGSKSSSQPLHVAVYKE